MNRRFATCPAVMRGHSRPKDGVLSHAHDPRIHDETRHDKLFRSSSRRGLMDCRVRLGNDSREAVDARVFEPRP